MRRRGERGFMLLEVLVLVMVILACLASVRMLDRAAQLNAADGARSQALFIAREELERLNYLGANGRLTAGTYSYLGDASDVQVGAVSYTPEATVTADGDVYMARVVVAWEAPTTRGSVELEGRVRNENAAVSGAQ